MDGKVLSHLEEVHIQIICIFQKRTMRLLLWGQTVQQELDRK